MNEFAQILPEPEKVKSKKRPIIIVIVIVGVLLISAGAAAYFTKGFGLMGNSTEKVADTPIEEFEGERSERETLEIATNGQIAEGQLTQAGVAYDEAIADAQTDEEKADLLVSKSMSFGEAGYHQQSLDSLLEAEKLYGSSEKSASVVKEIAKRYEQLGQFDNAIIYTNKALATLKTDQSDYAYQKEYYDRMLVWLKEQQ